MWHSGHLLPGYHTHWLCLKHTNTHRHNHTHFYTDNNKQNLTIIIFIPLPIPTRMLMLIHIPIIHKTMSWQFLNNIGNIATNSFQLSYFLETPWHIYEITKIKLSFSGFCARSLQNNACYHPTLQRKRSRLSISLTSSTTTPKHCNNILASSWSYQNPIWLNIFTMLSNQQ